METQWKKRIALAAITGAPSIGSGSFIRGNILVVGERPSNPDLDPSIPERPFCGNSGCSGWLNKLLCEAEIDESKIFWVNAFLKDGSKNNLRWIMRELSPSYVIALGTFAKKACADEGIEYYGLHHPQYWKRFRSKQDYPVISLLKLLQENIPRRNIVIG